MDGGPSLKTSAVIGLATILAGVAACGSEAGSGAGGGHAFVVRRAMAQGSTLYLGGTFREADNAAGNKLLGHEMLVVLDASDPTLPAFVAEQDMKLTRLFSVQGGKLLGVQPGFDEEAIDGAGPLPRQNLRLKVFGLSDPERPALERTIEIPGSEGASVTTAMALDARTVLISIGTGIEPADFPLAWIVRLDAAAGSEVAGSVNVACRAPVLDGNTLWCFNGQGLGTGYVVGFVLGSDGTLTETARAPFDLFILPVGAALGSVSWTMVVVDAMGGTFLVLRGVNGDVPSEVNLSVNLEGSEADAVNAGGGEMIVQTEWTLNVFDGESLAFQSSLSIPGQPYQGYAGGSSVVRLDAAAGAAAALDGLFAAALGDYGVALVRLTGQTLETVGGYYRRFGTDLIHEDTIHEGNY